MIFGRLFAYFLLSLVIMLLGAEGLRVLEGNDTGWISMAQVMEFAFTSGENSDRAQHNLLSPILEFPAFISLLAASMLLFFVSGRKFR